MFIDIIHTNNIEFNKIINKLILNLYKTNILQNIIHYNSYNTKT